MGYRSTRVGTAASPSCTIRWPTSSVPRDGVTAVRLKGGARLGCTVRGRHDRDIPQRPHARRRSSPSLRGVTARPPSTELAASLGGLGLQIGRLKTGTPPRLDRSSIDFAGGVRAGCFTEEHGDRVTRRRSRSRRRHTLANRIICWSLYTSEAAHDVVRTNIGRSPLYNGRITGVGPRYCPSLEDKVMRFPHRERHQLHLEPEGLESESIYVNGLSMSLPADVQAAIVRSLPGLEDARVVRPGYAVEYDFVQPTGLTHALESRHVPGLVPRGPGQRNVRLRRSRGARPAGGNQRGTPGPPAITRASSRGRSPTSASSWTTWSRRGAWSRTGCSRRAPSTASCCASTTPTCD